MNDLLKRCGLEPLGGAPEATQEITFEIKFEENLKVKARDLLNGKIVTFDIEPRLANVVKLKPGRRLRLNIGDDFQREYEITEVHRESRIGHQPTPPPAPASKP